MLWYVLDLTPVGRRLLFVGNGAEVSRLSGISVGRLRWGALMLAGGGAGLAAVINVGIIGAADPTSSSGFLLPAYAAAFLGATTISPGRFNVPGTVITVFFLFTGFTGLQLLGVPAWVQQVFYGGALVIAVAFAQSAQTRRIGNLMRTLRRGERRTLSQTIDEGRRRRGGVMKLAGEVALITGGAGGLGYATAENIAHLGGAVCIFDRDAERAGEACEQLKADYGARAIAATGDVTSRADVQAALELTERELGPVDMLVNAAGIVTMTGFADVTEEEWTALIDVDLTGIFIMCQIVGAGMAERGRGRIINIASLAGKRGEQLPRHQRLCHGEGRGDGLLQGARARASRPRE